VGAFPNPPLPIWIWKKTYQYKAFGVPSLGLKRGLEEKLVVAPYATLLALNVAPGETVLNLKRLAGLGLLGDYGYYEAMDFSRLPQRDAGSLTLKRGVIIEAYMAHHQGMAFLALTNFLHGNPFPRRFHSDSRVRAFEALLQERIPTLPPLHLISTRQSEPVLLGEDLIARQEAPLPLPYHHAQESAAEQRPLWLDDHQQRWRLQPVGWPGTYPLAVGSDL